MGVESSWDKKYNTKIRRLRAMVIHLLLSLLVGSVLGQDNAVVDYNRACPDGFFYAGEALVPGNSSHNTRDIYWELGDTSPIYSCYKFMKDQTNFVDATLECNELQGQLASINDSLEADILVSHKFMQFLPDELKEELNVTGETSEVLTSGIELSRGHWTWFGAGQPVDIDISSVIEKDEDNSTDVVHCISIRWEKDENKTVLVYSAVPCTFNINATLCEVKVYTTTWYAWMFTNWLQILFFLTLSVLLMSTCCMFQALFFRNARPRHQAARPVNSPPPYTPHPPSYSYNENYMTKANKYMQKGKEALSKVTLGKPKDDDQVQLSTA